MVVNANFFPTLCHGVSKWFSHQSQHGRGNKGLLSSTMPDTLGQPSIWISSRRPMPLAPNTPAASRGKVPSYSGEIIPVYLKYLPPSPQESSQVGMGDITAHFSCPPLTLVWMVIPRWTVTAAWPLRSGSCCLLQPWILPARVQGFQPQGGWHPWPWCHPVPKEKTLLSW